MTGEELFDKIGLVDDSLVEQTNQYRRSSLYWWLAAAACLAFLLCAGIVHILPGDTGLPGPVPTFSAGVPNGEMLTGPSFIYMGERGVDGAASAPPDFRFVGGIHLTAKAVAVLPDTYQRLTGWNQMSRAYRIFKMEVQDPLNSGMEGEFWYALPEDVYCDLTEYDTLLISMEYFGHQHLMKNMGTNMRSVRKDTPQLSLPFGQAKLRCA